MYIDRDQALKHKIAPMPFDVERGRLRFFATTPVHAQPSCTGRIIAIADELATIELEIKLADGKTVLTGEAVVKIG